MDREQFKAFVEETIENVIRFAEEHTGKQLPRKYCFQWVFKPKLFCTDIPEVITQAVYQDENHIRPCVDIGVGDLLEDGTLVIQGIIAGYAPKPFGKNWAGRDGPFVYAVGQNFVNKIKNA
jgi:hypothetical protein